MKRTVISLLLALALLVPLAAPAFAADKEPTLTGAEMVALLPSERPEVIPPDSVSLPWNEEDEERTFREIAELTQSLTAGKTTETEKARAVFEWVAKNIEYDHTAFEYWLMQRRGDRLTEEQDTRLTQSSSTGYAFYNRRAICSGYANLANFMLRLAGLPSAYIAGEASNLPHAWSAVCADGRWIIFDATWNLWDLAPDDRQIVEEITWPDGIWRMGIYSTGQVSCFVQNRYKDISSVTIPDSVNTLDDSAFANCTKLTSVTIPSNVLYLKNGVFKGCTALTSVDIPDSVTDMGVWTFWDCTALTSVTIPDSVTKIGQYTFNGCIALAHVDIPDSVTEIETNAFKNCTALTEVTIPGSVTKMGSSVFENCTALTKAVFRGGVTGIASSTFRGCSSLTSVAIPESVTSIGQAAFYNCPNVTDVYYSGSEEQWDAIEIKMFNSPLARGSTTRATFHYNSTMPQQPAKPEQPAEPERPAKVAYPSTQKVDVDGKAIEFQCYALKDQSGNDTNYIKLRDLADILNGSAAQFQVDWNGQVAITTKTAYTPDGSERSTPFSGQRAYKEATAQTLVDGAAKDLAAFTLTDDNGGGYTYYQLRDLGKALGFNVGWHADKGIFVETGKPYDPNN